MSNEVRMSKTVEKKRTEEGWKDGGKEIQIKQENKEE